MSPQHVYVENISVLTKSPFKKNVTYFTLPVVSTIYDTYYWQSHIRRILLLSSDDMNTLGYQYFVVNLRVEGRPLYRGSPFTFRQCGETHFREAFHQVKPQGTELGGRLVRPGLQAFFFSHRECQWGAYEDGGMCEIQEAVISAWLFAPINLVVRKNER